MRAYIIIIFFSWHYVNAQYYCDSVSFEKVMPQIHIQPGGNNLWQIGKPQKIFFNGAHGGSQAILTDTISNYPYKDTSSFVYVISNYYVQSCETCMEFWHKYDMDTLGDKGIIDASYDGGNTWVVVSDTSNLLPFYSTFMWYYDVHASNGNSTPHKLITNGKSDGWILSKFCWQWWFAAKTDSIVVPPDSLMIRFTFISDTISKNKEGWMIDDILTCPPPPGGCSGIESKLTEKEILVYPNPSTSEFVVKGKNALGTVTLYNLFGEIIFRNKIAEKELKIDISKQNCGVYILEVNGKHARLVKE